ncbi:ACP S-malonyltransferase [Dietzia timorensis]|uniref:ACP S-malonyltransferase n=1 Tax=Dietzia timorensis TaxID=499555 RepID=UPI000837777E|nr:ACP S-malonyltransferase [Dietzia timorensis]
MDTRPAFVFPGQGSQRPGMGSDVVSRKHAREIFARLEEAVEEPLMSTMLDGPEERLRQTTLSQLAVFGLSVALSRELKDREIFPAVVAGHSLGEFSALVAAGFLDFDSAAQLVALRAQAMSKCCKSKPGAMVAVFGVRREDLNSCISTALEGQAANVVIASENSPKQIVISGDSNAVAKVVQGLAANELGSTQALEVEGAFHSPLMQSAEIELRPAINALPLTIGHTPMFSSLTGREITDVDSYRTALLKQITSPVRWEEVTRRILSFTSGNVIEVGPGAALRSLVRKVERSRKVVTCDELIESRFFMVA